MATRAAWSARRARRTCSSAWLSDRHELRDLGAPILQAGRARGGVQLYLHVVRPVRAGHGFALEPIHIVGPFELMSRHAVVPAIENSGQLFGREIRNADIHLDGPGAVMRGLVGI